MTVLDEETPAARSLALPALRPTFLRRGPAGSRRAWLVAAAVLVVAAVVLAVLVHRGQALDTARADAASSARTRIPALLSYRHDDLGHDLAHAVDQTTGSFRSDYEALVAKTVRPTAERRKVDTTATVSGLGVVRARASRVVVLAFLTQSTARAGGAPVVSGSRVEVTMVRVGDRWLIGDLTPV